MNLLVRIILQLIQNGINIRQYLLMVRILRIINMHPVMFNALFLTYHALGHFLSEGIKLKQVVDWTMFLLHESTKNNWNEFIQLL